jgi:hypothetical protein
MALEFVKLVKGKDVVSQVGSLGFFKLGVESGSGDMEFSRVFSENSPATISAISAQISANSMTSAQVESEYGWKVGDTKDITLSTGEVIQMRIIGFNHDTLSDGSGKAGITLEMVNCLSTVYQMDETKTNKGGFPISEMNTISLPAIKATLPQEWQNVIKTVDKKSANGSDGNYTQIVTSSQKLFLLSEIELFGTANYAQNGADEGYQYEYWTGKQLTDTIKYRDNDGDGVPETASHYWLRSSAIGYTGNFVIGKSQGGLSSNLATNDWGVSFAFCI